MASTSAPLGSAGEREATTAQEAELARRAAAGDGTAFATLYDRYESRIYNFCHRLLGSPEDAADATQDAFLKVLQRLPRLEGRELNFSAYLFTAARNASYDMIGKRKKAQPVDEIPEQGGGEGARDPGAVDLDPERTAMLGSAQEQIRAANGNLPERQREVLVLREVEELSYDEIADIMGMNRNSVAQLISRARIKLRDELRGSALASVAVSSPDCERALTLIAARADGQLKDPADRAWLDEHMAGCDTCKVSEQAMEEAGRSYRGWLPLVPLLWLRRDTIAKAGELVHSDWSQIANQPRPGEHLGAQSGGDGGAYSGGDGGAQSGANGGAQTGYGAGADGGPGSGAGGTAAEDTLLAAQSGGRLRHALRGRRRIAAVLVAAVALLLGAFVAIVIGGDDNPAKPTSTSLPSAQDADATVSSNTGTTTAPSAGGKPKKKAKGKQETPGAVITTVHNGVTTTTTAPDTQTTSANTPRKSPPHHRRPVNTGSQRGGGNGPINLPTSSTPTPAAPPPPTTADTPPPPSTGSIPSNTPTTSTGSTPPPCRPSAAGRPCPPR